MIAHTPKRIYARAKEIAVMLGVGESTIWRWSHDATFPKPRKMGNRCTLWNIQEVLDYFDAKTEGLNYSCDENIYES